jgi:hypothetical protein
MELNIGQPNESDYIVIPNPIYDVVFRYLMADYESALIVLSTLTNEKIIKLHLEPLTHPERKGFTVKDPQSEQEISLFHLDFTATVELKDGSQELIMIELQKAAETGDIFRFKRYISQNFQHKRKEEFKNYKSQTVSIIDRPIRLVPVFILNFRIEHEINDLLIKVNRSKIGVFKNETLKQHNDFIDHLSYDMLVVQLPNLHNIKKEDYEADEYKQKLYALLKLFDQEERFKDNEHRLRVMRKLLPGFLERVINRLQAADRDNPDLEEAMLAEDEILKLLHRKENEIAFFKEELGQTKKELGQTQEQLDQTQEQLDQTQEQLDQTQEQLSITQGVVLNFAIMLKSMGAPTSEIVAKTGLSAEQIEAL